MSNTVSCVLSRHGHPGSLGYRVILADGTMHLKTESEVRCMVRGDIAIEAYDPHLPIESARDEPASMDVGPREGDVLLVRIDGCRAACQVLEVGIKRSRPLYTVKYDDGMLVQDHLVVPWCYLSTAPPPAPAPPAPAPAPPAPADATASDDAASQVAPPMSAKARGKRRMIDVMAEAAESMETPSPVETAAAPPPPPAISPPPDDPVADPARKRWEARELRNEQEYGELLDTIVL